MAVKQWNVGDVLSSADLNTWAVPLAGIKSANQTIISQTTYVNDADMRFTVAAGAMYEFHVYMRYSSGTGQDWKSSFTVPSGSLCRFQRIGVTASSAFGTITDFTDTDTVTSIGGGVGVIQDAQFFGILATGGTSGSLIFQWAQNTSGAFNTTLYQYSYLTGRRIG